MGKACERGVCDDGCCTCQLHDTIQALREERAAWERRWVSLRSTAEHDRDRDIPMHSTEARIQGEVERVAMIAVLDEMVKLEKAHPCVSPTQQATRPQRKEE